MSKIVQPPDGIILTISASMLAKNGYKRWLQNFLQTMELSAQGEDWFYFMRASAKPKQDECLSYIYLCIGNKIRYRCFYGGCQDGGRRQFPDGNGGVKIIDAKAWILLAGPVTSAPHVIKRQGFQGFRYTEKLF